MPTEHPSAAVFLREHDGRQFFEMKFRHQGRQVKRRIGPAWVSPGRVRRGFYDRQRAHVAADRIVREHVAQAARPKVPEATLSEIGVSYLAWLEQVRGAKPATLKDHHSVIRRIERELRDQQATSILVEDVEGFLAGIQASPRTVNKYRAVLSAIYSHGIKRHGLTSNPASEADRRREPQQAPLAYYTPQQIEKLADAMGTDGEAVRVSAYAGLRLGELLALRWEDVNLDGEVLTIQRAISAGVESSTKSGRVRQVPLPDQASDALGRLGPSTGRVFNIDPSTLRRRYRRAQQAHGLAPLRWHDLRHTYGSLLAAAGVDLVSIKDAMGHSSLTTNGRYLHARPAREQAQVFTRAFGG
jgi:integrase